MPTRLVPASAHTPSTRVHGELGGGPLSRRRAFGRCVGFVVGFIVAMTLGTSASAATYPTGFSTAPAPPPAANVGVSLGTAGAFAPPPARPSAAREVELDADGNIATEEDAETPRVRSKLIKRGGVPPFWIHNEYDTHHTRATAFPPLFIHRTPKPGHPDKLVHADLSLTFGWYGQRSKKRHWLNPVGLFYGSFSERKTVWGSVPLLAGYRRVGEQFNFGQFPLVWWWGTKYVKNFLFIPFHYQQKAPDGFRGVSALLFWYGNKNVTDANLENDKRHFIGAPIYWSFTRGLKKFDFAFLYIGGHNRLQGKKYMAVAPLFVREETEFGNRKELWTLPWVHRTDRARGRDDWAVPLALTFRRHDRNRTLLSATPLIWKAENRLKGSKTWVAGPLGQYDDPDQRNSFGAPLFFRFHDKVTESTTDLYLPLAMRRKTKDRTAIWTVLGGGRKTRDGWAFGVPPALTFFGSQKDGRRFGTVGGLVWHVRRPVTEDAPARSLWLAGPLGYADRRGNKMHLGVIPALTFAGWGGGTHYQVVTPLVWHVRDHVTKRRTLVAGPLYIHSKHRGEPGQSLDGGIAPLAFWGNGPKYRYGIVPWLLFSDTVNHETNHHLTLSPIFVQSKRPESRTIGVAGIVWDVKRKNERHSGVFPIYYRRQIGDRGLTLTPLGGSLRRGQNRTSVYGLFYRRKTENRDGWGVLPLLFHDKHPVAGGTSSHTGMFPLFLRRRTPADDLDVWSPLVWRSNIRGPKARRGLAVVPFYFRQRQPHGVDVDAGLGFFYSRDRDRRTHTIIGGPVFHRLTREKLHTGVAPLWWWMDSKEKRRFVSLPVIFHFENKERDEHTTVAVPLWFDRKRADGRRTWSAFPFVLGTKRGYNHTRLSLAPLGYFDLFRMQKNRRFVGFVPLLFRYDKCGFQENDDPKCHYRLWGSAPLFLYGKDGNGRRTHGALLYYWDKRPEGYKLYTPLFGVNNEPGKTLGWYGGPLAIKTTNTHRRSMFFPLWFRRAHRLKKESLTLAVPPLFITRRRQDRRFIETGLVFWQFRQQHKVSTAVAPPIFYFSHAYAERRLYWVLPFFIRDNNMGKDEAWLSIPVVYTQRRKGENLDLVLFPAIWHIERGKNQGTFGAFVWWDIRTKGRTFQMVPGLFTRWVEDNDTKVIGPGLAWWQKGRGEAEGNRSWRILFGAFGAGVEEGRRYTAIFGRRIDRGPAKPPTKAALRRQERRAARKAARQAKAELRRTARAARHAAAMARAKRRNERKLGRGPAELRFGRRSTSASR